MHVFEILLINEIQLMLTTRFVVFKLAYFFLYFFSGKYLILMLLMLEWKMDYQGGTD